MIPEQNPSTTLIEKVMKKLFLIANSQTSKELPFTEKEYLAPYPNEDSKQYIWKKGLVGAAGFHYEEAKIISGDCAPKGEMISMDSITKNVIHDKSKQSEEVEKYKDLIGEKIDLMFNAAKMNTFEIMGMKYSGESQFGLGKMYECSVNWDNKDIGGAYPELLFDERTLNELVEKKTSVCPFMPSLYYVFSSESEKKQKPN
jgi:hypothetical protein